MLFPDLDHPTVVFGTRVRSHGPPLGILYLATALAHAGYSVCICDFSAEHYHPEKLRTFLTHTDVVGITALNYARRHFHQLIRDIRHFNTTIPIMIGGPDCTIAASAAAMSNTMPRMPDGVDMMVIGEAEHTIVSIVDALMIDRCAGRSHYLRGGKKLSKCTGVIFRDRVTGAIRLGRQYHEIADLDSIPFHNFRFANRAAYTLFGVTQPGVAASIITSRGCPHKCRFCTRAAQSPLTSRDSHKHRCIPKTGMYRERSASHVLDEIQKLADAGYQVLYVVDDNFMVNEKRVHAILDGIIARRIQMAILAQGRVNPCSEELYAKMKAAGMQLLSYGLESGNQDVLDFYCKGTSLEQAWRAVELADKYGIFTHGNFILGAPIETLKHIKRTLKFAQKLPLDAAFFGVLNYTFGSELWDKAYQNGLITANETDVHSDRERGLGQFTRQELEQFCRRAHYRFYFRPTLWTRYLSKLCRNTNRDFAKLLVRGFLRFGADVLAQPHI